MKHCFSDRTSCLTRLDLLENQRSESKETPRRWKKMFLHQIRRPRLTARYPQKSSGNRGESPSDKRGRIPCRHIKFNNPSCNSGILPCVSITNLKKGCVHGDKGHFRHVEAEERPSKKSKKDGAKGSVALLKESAQVGCVSQDSHPRKSILRESGKLGSKTRRQLLQRHWHQIKIRER